MELDKQKTFDKNEKNIKNRISQVNHMRVQCAHCSGQQRSRQVQVRHLECTYASAYAKSPFTVNNVFINDDSESAKHSSLWWNARQKQTISESKHKNKHYSHGDTHVKCNLRSASQWASHSFICALIIEFQTTGWQSVMYFFKFVMLNFTHTQRKNTHSNRFLLFCCDATEVHDAFCGLSSHKLGDLQSTAIFSAAHWIMIDHLN